MKSNTVVYDDLNSAIQVVNDYKQLSNKTILVTGATGLIGSMFIKALLLANEKYDLKISVIAIVRNKNKAEAIFGDLEKTNYLKVIVTDSFNIDISCDYIVHTASITQSKLFVNAPIETLNTTIQGTIGVLELANKNKAKLLYLSSMEMYGVPYENEKVVTEKDYGIVDPLEVRSSYPEGKRVAESYCTAYKTEYGVDVCIARLAQTFGAGVDINDNRVFMQFAKAVIKGMDIELHTKGESVANFCYLSDAITALVVLLLRGKSGEAYNICNEKETRKYIDIAHLVADKVASGRIGVSINIPDNTKKLGYAPDVKMFLSSQKILKLGWIPNVSMKDAYTKLINYLREEGYQ